MEYVAAAAAAAPVWAVVDDDEALMSILGETRFLVDEDKVKGNDLVSLP